MTAERKSERKKTDEDLGNVGGGIFSSMKGLLGFMGDLVESGERISRNQSSNSDGEGKGSGTEKKAAGEKRFSSILNGLTDIAEKLNELSEKGESLSEKGEFSFPDKGGGIKGVYGFTL